MTYEEIYKESWRRYKAATARYWKLFPEVFAVGRMLVALSVFRRNPGGLREVLRAFKSGMLQVIRVLRADFKPDASIPSCDVMLCYSSSKPNTEPAMVEMAKRCAQELGNCAVVSPLGLDIWTRDAIQGARSQTVLRLEECGLTFGQALSVVLRSVLGTVLLMLLRVFRRPDVPAVVGTHWYDVWNMLLNSALRLCYTSQVLEIVRPKIIILSVEWGYLVAELLLSGKAASAYKVVFNNEYPTSLWGPVLSQEIWVWNSIAMDCTRQSISDGSSPKFSVVGYSQTDVAMSHVSVHTQSDSRPRTLAGSRRVLLFLSEYFEDDVTEYPQFTEKVVGWIASVAARTPSWFFVLKNRPLQPDAHLPGLEGCSNLKNVVVSGDDPTFFDFLGWDNLAVVASLSSSGLITAAGMGKVAIRLEVSPDQVTNPILEAVTITINSAEALMQVLCDIDTYRALFHQIQADDGLFPFRGRCLDRMMTLCKERLSILKRGDSDKDVLQEFSG